MTVRFVIDGDAVPKERARKGRGGHWYTPQRTRDAEDQIRWLARAAGVHKPFTGEISVRLWFHFSGPPRRIDLDNCQKLIQDALNGFVWVDDSQIAHYEVWRQFNAPTPHTQIEISEVNHAGG